MMSTAALQDPVDILLEEAQNGRSLIRDRSMLHFEYIPDMIYHRDSEQKKVAQSLLPILKQARPSNLLVYGKPGTGKTLVVKKVLAKIQERGKTADYKVRLLYANSKVEGTPYGLLARLGYQLGLDEKRLPRTGLSIPEVFSRIMETVQKEGINAVFVIDEIDNLADLTFKKHRDLLYRITRANESVTAGSVALVGISNDLAFKERLDPRVISSLSEEEVVFANYAVEQLAEILEDRVAGSLEDGAIDKAAINLCAAMAAAEHGDARRAIDLLRVAAEIAERDQARLITEAHIRLAAQKIEENKEEMALKSYPMHEKLALLAVMRSGGTSTGQIYRTYKEIARSVRQKELTQRRLTQMLGEIEMSGIISGRITHHGIHGRTKNYKLTISPDTVRQTFANDALLEDII